MISLDIGEKNFNMPSLSIFIVYWTKDQQKEREI